jgi:CRP/FNR family cyclic AMP-dependent transcriptional regulator
LGKEAWRARGSHGDGDGHRADYGQEDRPESVPHKVSQEMLAEMIGTTRPRVNMFMNKFRKLGFIEYNGEIKINKSLLTVVLHE